MIDYFALLDQPRVPWLDPAALKEIFHRKTLEQHPDSARGPEGGGFAELNKAYQVLQDPKRRLHHLLSLENRAPAANQAVPLDLQEIFLQIGALNQSATRLLEKMRAASNPLTKSLLKVEVIGAQKEVGGLRDKVQELSNAAESRLRQTEMQQLEELAILYQRFAYLGRWSAQLDELAFQLTL
ncbi:MAG TPA: DnaJ domain-containing protein [Chthoniobacterales bacterium]|nr:DnaJ domain-containing protein [Chthoniobacterales bacterium]